MNNTTSQQESQDTKSLGSAPPFVPHIGSFVLETLTLGMYGDPRHTLREYVQNAFDSIRAAKRTKLVEDAGRVTISFEDDSIKVFDDGLGVPAAQAWSTLTSIGASKKERQRDAGFRGIGRLAGMAYCNSLKFRTRFPGEDVISSVTFDCKILMAAMSPDEGGDIELVNLLANAVTLGKEDATTNDAPHFFEVQLNGLGSTPNTLLNVEEVKDYLRETSPVPFNPEWQHGEAISKAYIEYFGEPIETIDLTVVAANVEEKLYKLYGDEYEIAKKAATITEISFTSDTEAGFWSWVGRLSESGAVVGNARGLRVRLRNIQVDSTDIIEELFAEIKPSFGRFTYYYVGEIHIDPRRVVPNARRDNFEETPEWLDTKSVIREILLNPLRKDAYAASKDGAADITKLIQDIQELVTTSRTLVEGTRATYDRVVDLMTQAKRLRRRAISAQKRHSDISIVLTEEDGAGSVPSIAVLDDAAKTVEEIEHAARMMMGSLPDQDEKFESLKARVREQAIREVLDVVQVYVDASTFQRIKKHVRRSED